MPRCTSDFEYIGAFFYGEISTTFYTLNLSKECRQSNQLHTPHSSLHTAHAPHFALIKGLSAVKSTPHSSLLTPHYSRSTLPKKGAALEYCQGSDVITAAGG